MLAAYGLKPIANHYPYESYAKDRKHCPEAKSLGLQYAGCAWIRTRAISTRRTAAR